MIRPMLAAKLGSPEQLRFPLLVTPKLDGIRCLKLDGRALTRPLKLVPNVHVRNLIEQLPDGVDGELIAGDFNSTQSSIMSADGQPDFRFHIFDVISDKQYQERVLDIPSAPFVIPVLPTRVDSLEEFLAIEASYLDQGYEGIMARDATGPYKYGRSTLREHWLIKYKRYDDSEAVIVGFEEQLQNCNPIVRDVFGRAKRPGGRSLSQPKDTLGALIVQDGLMLFNIGTGFDDETRLDIWQNQAKYLGATVTYRYQGIGSQGRPRFPSFKGFRHDA